jgi:hypothetical protein
MNLWKSSKKQNQIKSFQLPGLLDSCRECDEALKVLRNTAEQIDQM